MEPLRLITKMGNLSLEAMEAHPRVMEALLVAVVALSEAMKLTQKPRKLFLKPMRLTQEL